MNFYSITLNGRREGYLPYVPSIGALLGLAEVHCLKLRMQPHDGAELVLFLISPAPDMITGQNCAIDGGW